MKTIVHNSCIWTFILLIISAAADVQGNKGDEARLNKAALIIGERNYYHDTLANPLNDAVDVGAALNNIGFTVTIDSNSTLRQLKDVIFRWTEEVRKNHVNVAVVYFAGHGCQLGGKNYLYPINAPATTDSNIILKTTYSASYLQQQMEAANGYINILMLDACRDDPTLSFTKTPFQKGLKLVPTLKRGTVVAYPVLEGCRAKQNEYGRNSNYARAVIDNFQVPGISIETIFKRIQSEVEHLTNETEHPIASIMLGTETDICLSYGDDSANGRSDFLSSSFAQSSLKEFRGNSVNTLDGFTEDSLMDIFNKIRHVVDSAIQRIVDSVGKNRFGLCQSTWLPDFDNLRYQFQDGICRPNYANRNVRPMAWIKISTAHTVQFSLVNEELSKFDKDYNIPPEEPIESPILNIDYLRIYNSVGRYLFLRKKFLVDGK